MKLKISTILNALRNQFRSGGFIIRLIFIYCGVYLIQLVIRFFDLIFFKNTQVLQKFLEESFYLSSKAEILIWKFYTLLSYQFLHDGLLHLLINILLLFFFGKVILHNYSTKKLIPLYFLGGIFAALIYRIACQFTLFNIPLSPIVGASASIMALLAASSVLYPNYKIKIFFFLDVPLKWFTLSLVLLQLFYLAKVETIGTGIIHLGGLFFGAAYVLLDRKGVQIYKPINKALDYLLLAIPKFKTNSNYVHSETKKKAYENSELEQDRMNAILDKISTYGYDSLSKVEKDYLFRASKN